MFSRATAIGFATALATCFNLAGAAAQQTPDYAALIAATDRSAADRETDARRDPLQILTFIGARPGMKVLDMGAGGGYSTELMARAVGPNGVVYGQNAPDFGARGKATFEARQRTPAGKPIVGLFYPFDDPLPADIRNLDLVTFLFFYHDTTYMQVNRAKMNARLFAALKPGGYLVIADHSASAGAGTTAGRSLHRIEESVLRSEVEAAGFKLVGEGDFWRHPEDTRDFTTQPPTKLADEFVLKFQKPERGASRAGKRAGPRSFANAAPRASTYRHGSPRKSRRK